MQFEPVVKDESINALYEGILKLESVEECYRFFEDLCTVKEVIAMAQRFEAARMLKNNATYQEVIDKTGMSTATISRINRCIHYGANGYNIVLDRMEEGELEE